MFIRLALAAALCVAPLAARVAFPLKASEGGRYFVDTEGRHFLYSADTAWQLYLKLPAAEAREYLLVRRAQGFTAVQTMLAFGPEQRDFAGREPFENADFAKPNEGYFAHVERVVEEARKLDMAIAIAPLWAGCCGEGWAGKKKEGGLKPINVQGPEKMRALGKWLGARFAKHPNVIWILGGDNDPHESAEHYRQLGLGLLESAPHLMRTFHAASTHSSTDVWPAGEKWLNMTMVYTYFRGFNKAWNKNQPDVYEVAWKEYDRTPVRPFILGESTYEGEHADWGNALQVRKQAYQAMLGGAAGHAYGSRNWTVPENWREIAASPGAASMVHLKTLFEARPWHRLVPDRRGEWAVEGSGTPANNDYSVTAYAADRTYAVSWIPSPRTVIYDLGRFPQGQVRATWFDPRNGATLPAGEYAASGRRQFTSPASHEWLLVLDAAAAPLAPLEPGFTSLFDGKSLAGWKLVNQHGRGYVVENGILVCPEDGGGNLYTEKPYSDFIFRFEFRMAAGANSGVGIRAPLEGDAAYVGMEIQILDNSNNKWGTIKPEQYHGSVYDVIPARTGYLKLDEWNTEEIAVRGRHVRVTLNGVIITDADLDIVREPEVLKKHPGPARTDGHVGFLGHGTRVEFRNIRIRPLR